MNAQEVWEIAQEELRLQFSRPSFETWIRKASLITRRDNVFTIGVPTKLARDWLEERYTGVIKETLSTIVSSGVNVNFVLYKDHELEVGQETIDDFAMAKTPGHPQQSASQQVSQLNPRFQFRYFVVGQHSWFAHAACRAVADSLAKTYNPLFVYGGAGVGKTHLMHAVGHAVIEKQAGHKVAYLTTEKFMNEMIASIQASDIDDFRTRYRSADLLLIDDIQFLADKERTQEEFFHTFNSLHDLDRQIVISSDRPPEEIPTLEDQLRSRFESGLIADIQPPDFETRIAILKARIKQHSRGHWVNAGPLLQEDVLTFVAQRIQKSVRELEGALIRLLAYAVLRGRPVSVESAETLLHDVLPSCGPRPVDIDTIARTVARFYQVSLDEMKGKRRDKHALIPRQVAMYLIRNEGVAALPEIGQAFGGRNHTTVLHSCEKISNNAKADPRLRHELQTIREIIHSN